MTGVLPQQTYADPAALRESTETKPLFAVDVRQHKGEILPHLIVRNPGSKKNNTQAHKKAKTKRIYGCSDCTNYHKFKKSVPAVSEINPFFFF